MPEARHTLILDAEVDQGRRLDLARVAARLEKEEMARAVEISVRSYERTVAGARAARPGELIVWARLTGQDLEFFGGASSDRSEAPILSHSKPPVKRRRKAVA